MTVRISIIPLAERQAAQSVDFHLDGPVDVMVDGEVLTLHCENWMCCPAPSTLWPSLGLKLLSGIFQRTVI